MRCAHRAGGSPRNHRRRSAPRSMPRRPRRRGIVLSAAPIEAGSARPTLARDAVSGPGQDPAADRHREVPGRGRGRSNPRTSAGSRALVEMAYADFEERVAPRWASLRAQASLDLAMARGLLHDLLLTGDRTRVDAAMERYSRA